MGYILVFLIFILSSKADTLEDILSKVEDNPYIKSNLTLVNSYEGEIIKSKAFPNPEGYFEMGRMIGNNPSATITEIYISQPLKLYNQRKYQTKSAIKEKYFQYFQFESIKRQYISNIYLGFYEALYYKELLKILEKETNLSKEILEFVEKTYKLGEVPKLDLLRSKKEYELSLSRLNQYKAIYIESLKNLSALAGYQINDVEGDFFYLRDIKDFDIENLADIKSLNEKIQSLEYLEKYYKALSYPQISVGFITKESSNNKYEAGFMVNFSIPVFYRNLGEIITVKHQRASFEYLREYKINTTNIKLSAIKENYQSILSVISDLDKTLKLSLDELNLAEKSYKLRTISLFEFSTIKNQYFESLKYRLELYKNLHQIYSKYLEIGGQL